MKRYYWDDSLIVGFRSKCGVCGSIKDRLSEHRNANSTRQIIMNTISKICKMNKNYISVDFVPIAFKLISLTFVSLPELMFFYHYIKVKALMIT